MKLTFSSMLGVVLTAVILTLSACGPAVPAAVQEIAPAAYQAEFVNAPQAHLLVDVRTPEEFSGGHIPGAVNIPLQELETRLTEIPADSPVVLYCRSGNRSAQAADILREAGYSRVYDLGGINAWQSQGLPVQ